MLATSDLSPPAREDVKAWSDLLCPFMSSPSVPVKCMGEDCGVFVVKRYRFKFAQKRPWCGCGIRRLVYEIAELGSF